MHEANETVRRQVLMYLGVFIKMAFSPKSFVKFRALVGVVKMWCRLYNKGVSVVI